MRTAIPPRETSGALLRATRRLLARLCHASSLLVLPLVLMLTASGVEAVQGRPDIVTSYGYAVFGTLKYPADFKHLDYANPKAPKGGTYRYAETRSGSFDSLNLMSLMGTAPLGLVSIYDTLMRRALDEPASRYALVAQSVSYPRDLSWVEFHLDPRARWHDGKPITVEDVIFTIEAAKGLVTPGLKRVAAVVARTEKTGPRSVRIYFNQKNNPTLPTVIMDMWLLPRHFYAHRSVEAATLEPPLGSGPYKIGRFSQGRWFELERVKDYWAKDLPINKGRYNFDIIRNDFFRDQQVAYESFLSGNSDLRFETGAARWPGEAKLAAFRAGWIKRGAIPYDNAAYYLGLVMNMRRPFLADREVRRALMLAYDFEWTRRVLLNGYHGRLTSFFSNSEFAATGLPGPGERALLETVRAQVPPEVFTTPPGLPVGGSWTNRRANLVKAAAILRAAGYRIVDGTLRDKRTGAPVALQLVAYSPLVDRQVSLFIENARRLGIAVNFRAFDSAQFRHRTRTYDYDLLAATPLFPTAETPSAGIALMWGSKAADMPQQLNYPGVKNPAVDAMIAAVVGARDRTTVVDAMRALDRILLWNYYAIPFQHMYPAPLGEIPITYWDRFGRLEAQPRSMFPFPSLDTWWIDPAKDARLARERGQ